MFHSLEPSRLSSVLCSMVIAIAASATASAQFPPEFGGGNVMPSPAPNHLSGMFGGPSQNGGPSGLVNPGQSNSMHGVWLASLNNGTNSMDARLELAPSGQFQLSVNTNTNGSANQTYLSGTWQVQGRFLIFNTNGVIERLPLQFDGQHLVIDIESEGVRIGFARNAQQSFAMAIPQPSGMGQPPVLSR